MTIFYSASRAGFFDDGIHDVLPDDVVSISQEKHADLMTAQSSGMIIAANDNGEPIAIDPPAQTAEEALANLRQQRDALLTACDWTQLPDAPFSEAERAAWTVYRQALRDLPETNSDPAAIEWPAAPA